jgi:hypothetical protein
LDDRIQKTKAGCVSFILAGATSIPRNRGR